MGKLFEGVHLKTMVVSMVLSAIVGGVASLFGSWYMLSRKVEVQGSELKQAQNDIAALWETTGTFVPKAQYQQFVEEMRHHWTEQHDFMVREDARADEIIREHARLGAMIENHVKKRPISEEIAHAR